MIISFNQPAFIPWGGFFARLVGSDKMILLDETLLARGFTFVNRNRLKGPQGEIWLTVPLKRKGRGRQKIEELEIYEKTRWTRNLLLTLQHNYGKSLYFEPIIKDIRGIVNAPGEHFLPTALALIKVIQKGLAIGTEFILQSEIGIRGNGTALLVSVAKELGAEKVILPYFSEKNIECERFRKEHIQIQFLRYDPPQYPQFWGSFIKNLSALDLLLCCGQDGKKIIEKGTYIYETVSTPECPGSSSRLRGRT